MIARKTKWMTVLLAALLIAGCDVLPLKSKNYVAGDKIPDGYGVLVTHLYSNWKLNNSGDFKQTLIYWARSADEKGSRHFTIWMHDIDDLRVIPIPEGHYFISELKLGDKYVAFKEDSSFDIRAGQISYIGDIHVKIDLFPDTAQFNVTFSPEEVKQALQEQYPGLLKSMEFQARQISLYPYK